MKQQPNANQNRKEIIRGFVVPEQWDDQFRVIKVLIACKGEREIRVENLNTFPALLSLTQKEAFISGTIRKKGAVESIIVESFTPIEPMEAK